MDTTRYSVRYSIYCYFCIDFPADLRRLTFHQHLEGLEKYFLSEIHYVYDKIQEVMTVRISLIRLSLKYPFDDQSY